MGCRPDRCLDQDERECNTEAQTTRRMMMNMWTTTRLSLLTMVLHADEKGALDRLVVLAAAVAVVQAHRKAIYKEEMV